MSEQNVVVVRSIWEAFLRNDFEAALSAFEPQRHLPSISRTALAEATLGRRDSYWAEVMRRRGQPGPRRLAQRLSRSCTFTPSRWAAAPAFSTGEPGFGIRPSWRVTSIMSNTIRSGCSS